MNLDRVTLRGEELEAGYASGRWKQGATVAVVAGQGHGTDLNSLPNDRLTLNAARQADPALRLGARRTLAAGRDGLRRASRGLWGA